MSQLNFWSQKNYMKRDTSSSSQSVAAPSTTGGGGKITLTTIAHNLGHVPLFRTYYEPFKDGFIYPPLGDRLTGESTNPSGGTGPYLVTWADSVNLYLELGYVDASLTGTYPLYYVIYRDYALA